MCFTKSLCCTHETNNALIILQFKNKENFQKKKNPLLSWYLQPRDETHNKNGKHKLFSILDIIYAGGKI